MGRFRIRGGGEFLLVFQGGNCGLLFWLVGWFCRRGEMVMVMVIVKRLSGYSLVLELELELCCVYILQFCLQIPICFICII